MSKGEKPRPKLSTVAPLLNGIILMSIWLNLFLAYSLYAQAPNNRLIVSDSITLSYFWVCVFLGLFLALLIGKLTNNWTMLRNALIVGLFVKAIFTYALIVVGLQYGFDAVVGVTGLWLAITWTQFFAVRTFKLPGSKYVK